MQEIIIKILAWVGGFTLWFLCYYIFVKLFLKEENLFDEEPAVAFFVFLFAPLLVCFAFIRYFFIYIYHLFATPIRVSKLYTELEKLQDEISRIKSKLNKKKKSRK